MDLNIVLTIIRGGISGFLILRILDNALAIACCLHGILMTRWKRLENKAKPGQIKYGTSLQLLIRSLLYGALFLFFLEFNNNLLQQKFHFSDQNNENLVWIIAAIITAVFFLRTSWRRLVVAWKTTHEFDYAEKRQRTFLLKK